MSNPILPIHAADPHLALIDGRYYLYATDAGVRSPASYAAPTQPRGFAAWSSADLASWRDEGIILNLLDVGWAKTHDWAPAAATRNGRYYLYFCADSQIGVAVSESPVGPFRDALGYPLVSYRHDMSAIDPMVFTDDDGQAYLHWGAVPGYWLEGKVELNLALSVRPLAPDMISFAGPERKTIAVDRQPGERWTNLHHIEAPFAFKRGDTYYLMWSAGSCFSSDLADAYRVKYATAPSAVGPWTIAQNPVLQSDLTIGCIAPGHHSVLQIPGTDRWVIAYHRHDGRTRLPTGEPDRRVCLDEMCFATGGMNGAISTIQPTIRGLTAIPIDLCITLKSPGPFRADAAIPLKMWSPADTEIRTVEWMLDGRHHHSQEMPDAARDGSQLKLPPGFHRIAVEGVAAGGRRCASAAIELDVL